MWRTAAASVAGSAHAASGTPCQDACLAVSLRAPAGPGVVLAVADGAGSEPLSHLGAAVALSHVAALATREIGSAAADEDDLAGWFHGAARAVVAEASRLGRQPRELASTLLVAVLLPQRALVGQVGDGAIVVAGEDGALFPVHWPGGDANLNETTFLTSAGWERELRLTVLEQPILEAAVLTDGLQLLALDFARRAAHRPFFAPFLRALREAPQGALDGPLAEYLGSEAVDRRTDDDRTLALATRRLASA